jgi:transposase
MKSDSVHIGVDVSKEKLNIYNPITKASTSEPNTPEGFRKIREAARKANAVVCCEPTGGLEFDMIMFLQKKQHERPMPSSAVSPLEGLNST